MERGDLERTALSLGQLPVGVDEVGRGCIAGPVIAAAVILDYERLFALPAKTLSLVRDSKTLSARQRQQVIPLISAVAMQHATASASVAEIEQLGIVGATFTAMRRALDCIAHKCLAHKGREQKYQFDLLLVDGNQQIPAGIIGDIAAKQQTVIKGDHWCYAIAAASILAKQARDSFMQDLATKFPQYGFENHVGYGTREHIENLKTHGISEWHRRGFEPVRSMCGNPSP